MTKRKRTLRTCAKCGEKYQYRGESRRRCRSCKSAEDKDYKTRRKANGGALGLHQFDPNKPRRAHPLYDVWMQIRVRCKNPESRDWRLYGARGISICEEWDKDFWAFVAAVGERPSGKTIDRINNYGNYEPGNVRWATPLEQMRNRRPRSEWSREQSP